MSQLTRLPENRSLNPIKKDSLPERGFVRRALQPSIRQEGINDGKIRHCIVEMRQSLGAALGEKEAGGRLCWRLQWLLISEEFVQVYHWSSY